MSNDECQNQRASDAFGERIFAPTKRDISKVLEKSLFDSLEQMTADALASGGPGNNPVVPSGEEIMTLYRATW